MSDFDNNFKIVGGVIGDPVSDGANANAEYRKKHEAEARQGVNEMHQTSARGALSPENRHAIAESSRTMHNGAQAMDASALVVKQAPEWGGVDEVGYDGMQMG